MNARRFAPAPAPVQESRASLSRVVAAEGAHHAAFDFASIDVETPMPWLSEIQRSFGRFDISSARAHRGEHASRAAGSMHARAFTYGDHVVFAGAPSLFTAAHEAAHVVQQRFGVDDERHADAVAQRVTQGRSSEPLLAAFPPHAQTRFPPYVQRQDAGAAPQPKEPPLKYSGPIKKLNPPPDFWDEATAESNLKKDLTSWKVAGVTAAMPKETRLYLLWILFQISSNRGQEADLVTAIGPAPKGQPAPVGRVTVRISEKGDAVVELIATGAGVPPAPLTPEAAKSKLKTDYGFADVLEQGERWTQQNLNNVVGAMGLVKTADLPAIKGVNLIRVAALPGADGLFSTARYDGNGGVVEKASLKLATRAFAFDEVQFIGGTQGTSPSSYQTIIHEVGHAVELYTHREARRETNEASGEREQKWLALDSVVTQFNALQTAAQQQAIQPSLDTAEAGYDTAKSAENAKKAAEQQTLVPAETANAIIAAAGVDAAKASAASALATAKTAVARLKPAERQQANPYLTAVTNASSKIATFVAAVKNEAPNATALENDAETAIDAQTEARDALEAISKTHPALAIIDDAARAHDAWFRAVSTVFNAPKRTKRVQLFVDLVKKKKIEPFTAYAAKNWPHKPGEFYAEAFSLWLTDREFLQKNYPDIFDFFEKGTHRQ